MKQNNIVLDQSTCPSSGGGSRFKFHSRGRYILYRLRDVKVTGTAKSPTLYVFLVDPLDT